MDTAGLAHLRRAHDLLDREYARPLDVPAMARVAFMSPSHFSRQFRDVFGETPTATCRPGGWSGRWRFCGAARR